MHQKKSVAIFLAGLLVLSACAPSPDIGGEGQSCTTKNACLDGLVCNAEKICVKPGRIDGGLDGSTDASPDAADDASTDTGSDASSDTSYPSDASLDAADGGYDSGVDVGVDAGADASTDAASDGGTDGSADGASDSGVDAGTDAGWDAGDIGVDGGGDGGVDAGPDAGVFMTAITPANPYVTVSKSVQFSATVSGAADKSIKWEKSSIGGFIDASSGYFVAPDINGDVTITATCNVDNSVFKTTTAHVVAAPSIISFTPNPNPALYGGKSKLTAVFSDGAGMVDNGIGMVTSGVAVDTGALTTATTFKLTVTNLAGDSVTNQVTVNVQSVVVSDITPANSDVTAGKTKQFSANVTGAFDPTINWNASAGSIDGTGKFTAPSLVGSVTITAKSHADPSEFKETTAHVVAAPVITSFTVGSNPIDNGGSTTLTGVFSNGTGSVNKGVGSVTSGVAKAIGPLTATTTYTLTVSNSLGDSVTADVTVNVNDVVVGDIIPSNLTVLPEATVQFTAEVTGAVDTTIDWTASSGSIDDTGKFAAPDANGDVTITAASNADPTKFKATIVHVSDYCLTNQCFAVPPTGQTYCYNDSSLMTCPSNRTDYGWGQDAQFIKPRTFTCYNADGSVQNPCTATATINEVVADSVTGLVWQRAKPASYSGCTGGTPAGSLCKWQEAKYYCKNLDYGGHQDWRLPNLFELESIVDHQKYSPSIDTTVFPGTPSSSYWSSLSYVYETTVYGWYISFNYGGTNKITETNTYYARCVRGGAMSDGVGRYVITEPVSGQQVVTDMTTGLMWGEIISNKKWTEALNYCATLLYGGFADWRMPNANEMISLADDSCGECISSSSYAESPSLVWTFNGLIKDWGVKTSFRHVRCVRLGP